MLTCKVLIKAVLLLALAGKSRGVTVTSDPVTATYSLSALAIGDWGTTVTKGSCCSRSATYNNYDANAEDIMASLMDIQAGKAEIKLKVVIGHGDTFYWTGINSLEGRDSRFATTFEEKFSGNNIKTIPWVNVLGNHDYGDASYVCNSGDNNAQCETTDALLQSLDNKIKWQSEYTSPNDNRWILEDHFYVHHIEDAASGVSIDIFNLETNDADAHGAHLICCQCYGYSNGDSKGCKSVARGDAYCCGGDTAMYDACYDKFAEWGQDSRNQLAEKVNQSTATWKIVNSHYGPYDHYAEAGMNKWFDVLRGSDIQAFLYGHTHGEKHDYSESLGMHFVENGAGGGIQKESASGIPRVCTLWRTEREVVSKKSLQVVSHQLQPTTPRISGRTRAMSTDSSSSKLRKIGGSYSTTQRTSGRSRRSSQTRQLAEWRPSTAGTFPPMAQKAERASGTPVLSIQCASCQMNQKLIATCKLNKADLATTC